MELTLLPLIDDQKCFETVRRLRWPTGVACPHCESMAVTKRGMDETQACRQRYHCGGCGRHFDDLTGTIFAGHHQPLRVWLLCLYFMGLNLSNRQIARELSLDEDSTHDMASQLREGIVARPGHLNETDPMGLTPHLLASSNCTHVRCHFHPDFPPESAAIFNRAQQNRNPL